MSLEKRFVKVNGLSKIFNTTTSGLLDITSIQQEYASKVTTNSIIFLTAIAADTQYGYREGSQYIWTHGELYATNDVLAGKNVSINASSALDVLGYIWDPTQKSFAEGYDSSATGLYAHSEGYYSTASGTASHAEGTANIASGWHAHAEGYTVDASGAASHAEGVNTKALSQGAHAEGYISVAQGEYSHAEGYNGLALGFASHAEGINTYANGLYSHTEGESTTASGYASHAEGLNNIVSGTASHVEGENNTVYGRFAHAEGSGHTILSGRFGHAEGAGNIVSNDWGHVEGDTTLAGRVSHAEGQDTFASDFGHVEGVASQAIGQGAHAEGYYTYAGGQGSHAEGRGSLYDAFNNNASYKNFVFSNVVILHRPDNKLYDVLTVTCPPSGIPITPTASVLAKTTVVYFYGGGNTYVVPTNTTAISTYTTDESGNGIFTINTAPYFYVRDVFGSTSPIKNFRLTYVSQQATKVGAHVEGQYTQALGTASHAEGQSTIAQNIAEHAQGQYNQSHTGSTNAEKTIHSVGIGTAETARKNVVEVMQDASVYIKDIGGYDGSNYLNASSLQEVVNSKQSAGNYATVQAGSTLGNVSGKLIVKDGTTNNNQIKTLDNGTNGQVLAMTSGSPAWSSITGSAGTANGTIQLKVGNVSTADIAVKGLKSAAYKDFENTISGTTPSTVSLPTSKAVVDYVDSRVIGGMTYKGVVSEDASLPVSASTGWVYVANASFTHGTTPVEPGDWFLYNGTSWDIVNGENQVDAKNPTLSFGSTSTVAIVDGTSLKVTMPSETTLSVSGSKGSGTTVLSTISVNNHVISYQTVSVSKANHTHNVTVSGNTGNTSFTPAGTVSVTASGATTTFTGSYTPAGSITIQTLSHTSTAGVVSNTLSVSGTGLHSHSFSGTKATISMAYDKANANTGSSSANVIGTITMKSVTPAGSISATLSTTTSNADRSGLSNVAHSHSFSGTKATVSVSGTPAGTISKPDITVTSTTQSVTYTTGAIKSYTSSSVTSSGATTGTVVTSVSYTTASKTVELIFGNATVSATSSTKYITAIELTTSSFTNITKVTAALAATPTFNGSTTTFTGEFTPSGTLSSVTVTMSGNITYNKTTGVNAVFSGSAFTPEVSTFTLTAASHSHSIGSTATTISTEYTPAGTLSKEGSTPTLSGGISVTYDKLTSAKGTFSGTASTISVSGTPLFDSITATFSGEQITHSHSFSTTSTTGTEL